LQIVENTKNAVFIRIFLTNGAEEGTSHRTALKFTSVRGKTEPLQQIPEWSREDPPGHLVPSSIPEYPIFTALYRATESAASSKVDTQPQTSLVHIGAYRSRLASASEMSQTSRAAVGYIGHQCDGPLFAKAAVKLWCREGDFISWSRPGPRYQRVAAFSVT
jgi:hypothetical protein